MGEGARGCGERELCTRRSPVHLARPRLPPEPEPEPGPGLWGAGREAGCGAAGEWGAGRPPQLGEVLEVRGMGRNPTIRPCSRSAFLRVPPYADEAESRAWVWGFTPTPPLARPAPLQPPGPGLPSAPTNRFLCFAGLCWN